MRSRQAIISGQGHGLKCLLRASPSLSILQLLSKPLPLFCGGCRRQHNCTMARSRAAAARRAARAEVRTETCVLAGGFNWRALSKFNLLYVQRMRSHTMTACQVLVIENISTILLRHPFFQRNDAGAMTAMQCTLAGCSCPIARELISTCAASSTLHRPPHGFAQQCAASAAVQQQQCRCWRRRRRICRTACSHTSCGRAAAPCDCCARAAATAAVCGGASSWRRHCHKCSAAAAAACQGACAGV